MESWGSPWVLSSKFKCRGVKWPLPSQGHAERAPQEILTKRGSRFLLGLLFCRLETAAGERCSLKFLPAAKAMTCPTRALQQSHKLV